MGYTEGHELIKKDQKFRVACESPFRLLVSHTLEALKKKEKIDCELDDVQGLFIIAKYQRLSGIASSKDAEKETRDGSRMCVPRHAL